MTKGEKAFEIFLFIFESIVFGIIFGISGSTLIFGIIFKMWENNFQLLFNLTIFCSLLLIIIFANSCIRKVKESIKRTESTNKSLKSSTTLAGTVFENEKWK
jgi:Na+/melibiose symporter-like transporter